MRVLNARRAVYRCTNRPAAAVGDRKQSVRHQASEACTSMHKHEQSSRSRYSADAKRGIGSTQKGAQQAALLTGGLGLERGITSWSWAESKARSAEHRKGRKACWWGKEHRRRDQRGGSCKWTRGSLYGTDK